MALAVRVVLLVVLDLPGVAGVVDEAAGDLGAVCRTAGDNRATREVTYGRIPAGSVVVAGNLPAADGSHSLYCAVIVKQVDAQTRSKTSINELLRGD